MAEIISSYPADSPPRLPLRLVLKWRWIVVDYQWLEADYQIGLFLGDKPLFNPAAYFKHAPILNGLEDGCFHGETSGLQLIKELDNALATNRTIVMEDGTEPWIKIAVGTDLFPFNGECTIPDTPLTEHMELAAVIQHGGSWHGEAMSIAGPAMIMAITRTDLKKFRDDLFNEAVSHCAELGMAEQDVLYTIANQVVPEDVRVRNLVR